DYPAIGTMTISLFGGGSSYSATYTLTPQTINNNGTSNWVLTASGGVWQMLGWGINTTFDYPNSLTALVGPGSNLMVSGCNAGVGNFNGMYTCVDYATASTLYGEPLTTIAGSTTNPASGTPILTYWPSVFPFALAGQNASGAGGATVLAWGLALDLFDFVWNPIFITAATNTCTASAAATTNSGFGGTASYSGFTAWTLAQVNALQPGTWVTIAGFATGANNGTYQVVVAPT